MKKTTRKKMEGAKRVYHGSWANSKLAGGFCWRMSARTSGETERGFGKKSAPARSPTKVLATQAKVSMTSILFYVVCKVVCFYSQVFVP